MATKPQSIRGWTTHVTFLFTLIAAMYVGVSAYIPDIIDTELMIAFPLIQGYLIKLGLYDEKHVAEIEKNSHRYESDWHRAEDDTGGDTP